MLHHNAQLIRTSGTNTDQTLTQGHCAARPLWTQHHMNTGKEFCSTMNLGSQLVMLTDDYRFNGVTSEMEEFALPTGIAFSVTKLMC